MIAKRWANQDLYRDAIEWAAATNGVPTSLAYGVIAQESGFNANAIRNEPGFVCPLTGITGDASYGLTQVLDCTALGLGYTGPPAGLLDVSTNLSLGLRLLGSLLRSHGGDVAAAVSAYNGGDRAALGYGARRADGTFGNQAYVTNVLNFSSYFDAYLAERDAAENVTTAADPTLETMAPAPDSTGPNVPTLVAGAAVLALGGWLLGKLLRS